MRCLLPMVVVTVVVACASSASAAIVIGGTQYVPVLPVPNESLTAPFKDPGGGLSAFSTATSLQYQGFVELNISGSGQSYLDAFNDAFWLYTYIGLLGGGPSPPAHDGMFGPHYQLAMDTQPIQGSSMLNPTPASQRAATRIYYDIDAGLEVPGRPYSPAYRSDHTYSVVVDAGPSLSNLYFTVADGNYADDTGAYNIQLTQLVPQPNGVIPEPTALIVWSLLGAIAVAWGWWRRARRTP